MRYSLSFGRVYLSDFMGDTQIILIDEITPDNCHLLDLKTGERLDLNKDLAEDVYDEQKATKIYQEIARRFGLLDAGGPPDLLTISL